MIDGLGGEGVVLTGATRSDKGTEEKNDEWMTHRFTWPGVFRVGEDGLLEPRVAF
jgi:hypothetical protein